MSYWYPGEVNNCGFHTSQQIPGSKIKRYDNIQSVDAAEPGSSLYARLHLDVILDYGIGRRKDPMWVCPTIEDIFSLGNYSGATEISFQSGTGTSTATTTVIPQPKLSPDALVIQSCTECLPKCRIQMHYLRAYP